MYIKIKREIPSLLIKHIDTEFILMGPKYDIEHILQTGKYNLIKETELYRSNSLDEVQRVIQSIYGTLSTTHTQS